MVPGVVSLDHHMITDRIAQGGLGHNPRQVPALVELAFSKFDVVVLCAVELQPKVHVPKGKRLMRFPIDDDDYRPLPPEVGLLAHQMGAQLARLARSGKRVLITCAQGVNRSGLITAMTLLYATNLPPKAIVDLIRKKRKAGGGFFPLCNPMFEMFVLNARRANFG